MHHTSPVRRVASLIGRAAVLLVAGQMSAVAQAGPWAWGLLGNPTTRWSPEAVSDYLLTGQTPRPAVVRIVAPEHGGTSLGSGVLVDANRVQGLVLTNYHVIRDSRAAVLVQFPDGFQSAGTVIRWDEAWDLAAIVIWRPPVAPVQIAAAPPQPGDRLTIAGFGRGIYREESGPCTEYLSPGAGYPKEFVELKATARQGDSGGPIFTADGSLAGVLFGQNDGRTLGSCSTRVRAFLASAGSAGFTPQPGDDVESRALDARQAGAFAPAAVVGGAAPSGPVRLQAVTTGGPATVEPSVPEIGAAGGPAPAWPEPALPDGRDIWQLLDVNTNGPALLSSAGGLALVVLGLRTVFGGRRRERPPADETW